MRLSQSVCGAAALLSILPTAGAAQSIMRYNPQTSRPTVGGYGEVHYLNPSGPNSPATINLARFIIYLANAFTDKITVRSEIEWENAKVEGGKEGGEVSIEQLFLDYRFSDAFTFRTGLLLPPVGLINETHEPPTFNGVRRPELEHDLIPATWRELGLGAAGNVPGVQGLAYRVYLLNGLRASGFDATEGIRGGRQEGSNALFTNPSITGRVEYGTLNLKLGGSFWYGGSAEDNPNVGTGTFSAPVLLLSADARYDVGAFSFRGLFADIHIGDAEQINAEYGNGVGSHLIGGYVEGAFNVLKPIVPTTSHRLDAFVRYENYDTQKGVPAGTTRDLANARQVTTVGLTYKPVATVAFKGDYQFRRNKADAGEQDVLAFGVGYMF